MKSSWFILTAFFLFLIARLTFAQNELYKILGLTNTASAEQIKSQYRLLAKRYHPDLARTNDDRLYREKKFKELAHAYTVLGDTNSRANYDQSQGTVRYQFTKTGKNSGNAGPAEAPPSDRVAIARVQLKNQVNLHGPVPTTFKEMDSFFDEWFTKNGFFTFEQKSNFYHTLSEDHKKRFLDFYFSRQMILRKDLSSLKIGSSVSDRSRGLFQDVLKRRTSSSVDQATDLLIKECREAHFQNKPHPAPIGSNPSDHEKTARSPFQSNFQSSSDSRSKSACVDPEFIKKVTEILARHRR